MFPKQMEKRLKTLRPPRLWISYIYLIFLTFIPWCNETCMHNEREKMKQKKPAFWIFQSALNLEPNQPTLKNVFTCV